MQDILTKITYGLYLITADEYKDNGCIANTVVQVSLNPLRVAVSLTKTNLTTDMIAHTGKFNISILAKTADFKLFKRFGLQSGRNADKFDGVSFERSENGLAYITEHSIAYVSCRVTDSIDLGSHTLFIAEPCEGKILSDAEPISYDYYYNNVRPKPQQTKKSGYVCKICGYVYEGDTLPPDFICPLCKHPASDFEKL
ncbi:MAG: flavin reductase [Clostridia bacterium]|nr:flavin reductase [Clostridia bacterium]